MKVSSRYWNKSKVLVTTLFFGSFSCDVFTVPRLREHSSHPICIEGLHCGDYAILRWGGAVAALTGGKQDKSLPSSVLSYGRDAVNRESGAGTCTQKRKQHSSHDGRDLI